jgi:hypothetical protein
VHLADALHALDVWFVGVTVEWVDEEDDRLDLTLHHTRCDLHVATLDSREHALHAKADATLQQASRAFGRNQLATRERQPVEFGKRHHVRLLRVVGYEGDGSSHVRQNALTGACFNTSMSHDTERSAFGRDAWISGTAATLHRMYGRPSSV